MIHTVQCLSYGADAAREHHALGLYQRELGRDCLVSGRLQPRRHHGKLPPLPTPYAIQCDASCPPPYHTRTACVASGSVCVCMQLARVSLRCSACTLRCVASCPVFHVARTTVCVSKQPLPYFPDAWQRPHTLPSHYRICRRLARCQRSRASSTPETASFLASAQTPWSGMRGGSKTSTRPRTPTSRSR